MSQTRSRGAAVAGLLIGLSLLLVSFVALALLHSGLESRAVNFEVYSAKANYLAESGVEVARAKLSMEPSFRGTLNGKLGRGRFRVAVTRSVEGGAVILRSEGEIVTPEGTVLVRRVVVR